MISQSCSFTMALMAFVNLKGAWVLSHVGFRQKLASPRRFENCGLVTLLDGSRMGLMRRIELFAGFGVLV
jgi:hypothetical protein